jgi:hypothetical protein
MDLFFDVFRTGTTGRPRGILERGTFDGSNWSPPARRAGQTLYRSALGGLALSTEGRRDDPDGSSAAAIF